MIDRRSFLQCTILAAAIPAFADFFPLFHEDQSHASQATVGERPMSGNDADENRIVFTIEGWDCGSLDGATDQTMSISVNQLWRAAWR